MNDFNETQKEYENRIDSLNLNITGGCNRCRHYKSEFNDQFKLIHFVKINNNLIVNLGGLKMVNYLVIYQLLYYNV